MTESRQDLITTEAVDPQGLSEKAENETYKASAIRSSPYLLPAMVIALTFFTYAGTLGYEFVYDDVTQIVNNPRVKDWSYVPDYFVSHIWVHRDPGENGNYYRPAFLIWLLINYKLLGLNTWSWHLVTILTHLVATFAVFLLAERLTRDRLTAFLTSLIFGLHPIHIETVAWVSGITEPLMAIPLIFSFLAYLNNREGRAKARLWFATSLVLYSVALLEKESSVILIGFIFAYEFLFRKDEKNNFRRMMEACTQSLPYLMVAALYLMARTIALNGFSHIQPENNLSIFVIFFTLPSVLWGYAKLLIFPIGLSADYDTPIVTSPGLWNFYLPALMLVLISVGLWRISRRKPVVQFGILLLSLPLLPVLNLRIFGTDFLHDRYLYLPSIGFSLLIAMAIRQLKPGNEMFFGQSARYAAASFVLAFLLVPATTFQSGFWADDVILHYRRVATAPNRPALRFNFADILYEKGMYREASEQYEKLNELIPGQYTSNSRLGQIALMSRNLDKAELYLRRAIETAPGKSSLPHMLLGFVLKDTNRFDDAIQSFRLSLQINPKTPNAHYGIGLVLLKQGRPEQALEFFKRELAINPDLPKLQDYITETEAAIPKASLDKSSLPQSVGQQEQR